MVDKRGVEIQLKKLIKLKYLICTDKKIAMTFGCSIFFAQKRQNTVEYDEIPNTCGKEALETQNPPSV
jgi:hypothetical protein